MRHPFANGQETANMLIESAMAYSKANGGAEGVIKCSGRIGHLIGAVLIDLCDDGTRYNSGSGLYTKYHGGQIEPHGSEWSIRVQSSEDRIVERKIG